MNKFYTTNNISESHHRKINYYLPKNATTPKNFSKAIKKLFLDNLIKLSNILRNDYKTRAILEIISEMNLNEEPKWIDSKIFKDYQLKIIRKNNDTIEKKDIINIFISINVNVDIDIFKKENGCDDNELQKKIG